MKKSILASCLALTLLNTMPSVYAADSEQLCCMVPEQKKNYLAPANDSAVLDDILEVEELKTYLRSQFAQYNTNIDIAAYKIPFTSAGVAALGALISDEMPECFHVDLKTCWGFRGLCLSIDVEYLYNAEEYAEKLAIWQENTHKILNGLGDDSSLSDVQKALLLHDRLAVHCEYDYGSFLAGNISEQSYDAYGALVNGTAVCSGYADAYKYLLEKVGIESYICSSDTLDHAWNIVYIDGDCYHVDVTWDDPSWDVSGQVYHNNFMLSSSALFSEGHVAYDYDTTPNNTKYDNYFWKESDTEFQLIDGEIYYIDNNSAQLKKYDGSVLCSVWDRWAASDVSDWIGNFSRLSSYNGSLYYSQSKAIYKYDLRENSAKKVYEPSHNFGACFGIYGFRCLDGNLICELNDNPIFMADTKEKYRVTDIIEPETAAYAAQIGEVKYITLAAAIEAAAKGATIDLLADAEAVTVAKAVTINKNGYAAEITVDGTTYGMVETDEAYIVYPMIGSTSGVSLLLKDMIQISYKSLATNFTDKGFTQAQILKNAKLLVWTGDAVSADATYLLGTETETIDLTYESGNKAYAGNADGIPARLMGDVQKYRFCITDADGVVWYSNVKEYSPKTYAINMYGKSTTSAKDKALVVALMNYGAAAQVYFDYKQDDPMNSWLPEDKQNVYTGYTATELKADTAGKFRLPTTTAIVKNFGKSAVLKGAIEINIQLNMQTAHKNSKLTLLYWTEDAYNGASTLTEANATGDVVFDKSGTYPAALINGIPARLLGNTVFFCVKAELNGEVSYSPLQTYSIHQYCVNTINKDSSTEALKNLAAAILIYSNAAEAALGK